MPERHEHPGQHGEDDEQRDHEKARPTPDVPGEDPEDNDDGCRGEQRHRLDVVSEEHGDDDDPHHVVQNREREHEDAQSRWDRPPENGEHT